MRPSRAVPSPSTKGSRPLGVPILASILILAGIAIFLFIRKPASALAMDAGKWGDDLTTLAHELPKRHVAPETERPVAAFEADVESVRTRIPSLTRDQIVLEMVRLAATFGDSHTEISLAQPSVGFHRFPLGLYFFGDDLRVVATDSEHRALLGTRLVAVGQCLVPAALDRLRPMVSDDFGNPYEIRHSGPALLTIPEVLGGLGIVQEGQPVRYRFESDAGGDQEASFNALPFDGAVAAMTERVLDTTSGPLFVRNRDDWQFFASVPNSRLLYVRLNRSLDQPGHESLAEFTKRVGDAIATGAYSTVLVDLRQDTGGNFHKTEPLNDLLKQAVTHHSIQQVYVGLGRHTYSAAILLAAGLKHDCGAIFAGETPRAVPNHQADVEDFELPNSRIKVSCSVKLWRPFPELGDARTIPIDVPAPWTWEDYRAGRDPVLSAVLTH